MIRRETTSRRNPRLPERPPRPGLERTRGLQTRVDIQKLTRAISVLVATGVAASILAPPASAVPGPEVEYVYNVIVRRHFTFPNNDAIKYGFSVCDQVGRGRTYGEVMGDVKRDVFPNDEQSANYVVSYAVGILCPEHIWQLRNTAAGYQSPR